MRKPRTHPQLPRSSPVKAGKGKGVYQFTMAISPLDCMGCGVCVGACPEKVQAIKMVPQETQLRSAGRLRLLRDQGFREEGTPDCSTSRAASSRKPLLEFSGSCAGCAETSYARLVTQLFGDRMYISNATGCSSIWGGPAATISVLHVNAERPRSRMVQLPVRGQRGARPRHVPRPEGHPRAA